MQALGSFLLLFLCAARLAFGPANSPWLLIGGNGGALADCFLITMLCSGVLALLHSDDFNKSTKVIFFQIVLGPLVFVSLDILGDHSLRGLVGKQFSFVLACLTIISLINFTTVRHQFLGLMGYLSLDLMLSGVSVYRDNSLENRPLAFVLTAFLGALIIFVPIAIGGWRRSRCRESVESSLDPA